MVPTILTWILRQPPTESTSKKVSKNVLKDSKLMQLTFYTLIFTTMILHSNKFAEPFMKLLKKALFITGLPVIGKLKLSSMLLAFVKNTIFTNLLDVKINTICWWEASYKLTMKNCKLGFLSFFESFLCTYLWAGVIITINNSTFLFFKFTFYLFGTATTVRLKLAD